MWKCVLVYHNFETNVQLNQIGAVFFVSFFIVWMCSHQALLPTSLSLSLSFNSFLSRHLWFRTRLWFHLIVDVASFLFLNIFPYAFTVHCADMVHGLRFSLLHPLNSHPVRSLSIIFIRWFLGFRFYFSFYLFWFSAYFFLSFLLSVCVCVLPFANFIWCRIVFRNSNAAHFIHFQIIVLHINTNE